MDATTLPQAPDAEDILEPAAASQHPAQLDTCLEELCGNTGLYSRNTFQGLTTAIVKLIRSQKLNGLVLSRTVNRDERERLALLLEEVDGITWLPLETADKERLNDVSSPELSVLLVLTNRLSATVFWNGQTEARFRTLHGGWSFHPGDTRRVAGQLEQWLQSAPLSDALSKAPNDRRFDEPMTRLISSLVESLEGRNRELSLALARESQLNQKVLQSERLAAIGQLCSVIAHEIRNPLGLIGLYAQLIEGQLGKLQVEDDALKGHLKQIADATQSLEGILSELTQYSRPLTLKCEPTDLAEFVEDVCTFVQPSFDEKGVTLNRSKLKVDGTLPELSLDRQRIRQALINLLKNGLEATESGKTIFVSLSSRQHDDQVFIRVRDEGSGIKEDHQEKLFTPYFSTKQQGTGLGLAHVRKILQAHGGNAILLNSEPGKGSTFALVLPKSNMLIDE